MNNETQNTSAVATAQAKIETIRQAIIGGDTKLNANDLAAARNDLEFAELQETAREIAEQKATNEKRKANLLSLQETLRQIADSRPAIEKKFIAFEKSLDTYLASVVVYQKQLTDVRQELANGGFLVGFKPGPIEGINTSEGREVVISNVAASNIEPIEAIRTLVDKLIGEHLHPRVR